MSSRCRSLSLVLALALAFGAGCSSSSSDNPSVSNSPATGNSTASVNKADYPVFPDADSGADSSVSAHQGGKGFTGAGWQTNTDFDFIGDPRAVKGGVYRQFQAIIPGTLRMEGPEWNTPVNYSVNQMVYEPLLMLDPNTLEFAPMLATHWQISEDKMTYSFRINPNARWSDGEPVTSDDVVRTWVLYTDKTLQNPASYSQFVKFEKPVAESKYVVRVKAKDLHWQNFLNFATMPIFPGHILKNIDGAAYLRDYNFKLLPGTGAYVVNESDIQKGKSVTARRRKDYWAEKARINAGMNNFDEVRWVFVRDGNLAFEMFKKGDFDMYPVNRSREWVEDLKFDKVDRGLIQRRKVFHNKPEGLQGFPMNTRRPPFDDLRVRKALALLLNRPLLLEKLFFNEYLPDNSYYPGSIYENPDNPKNEYNPQEGLKLLAEAGWNERNAQGNLTKAGRPLTIEMLYYDKTSETYLTVYQDDLRKLGITMNLRLVTPETQFSLVQKHQFDMTIMKWSASLFPNPEVEYHSRLADPPDTNNITGFKDPRIDAICDRYAREFDVHKRSELIRELDGILTSEYHYALHWYPPADRIAYWNKFGQPQGTLTRTGDNNSALGLGPGAEQLWWIDSEKARKLDEAMRDSSIKLAADPVEDHYWQEYSRTESQNNPRQGTN